MGSQTTITFMRFKVQHLLFITYMFLMFTSQLLKLVFTFLKSLALGHEQKKVTKRINNDYLTASIQQITDQQKSIQEGTIVTLQIRHFYKTKLKKQKSRKGKFIQ